MKVKNRKELKTSIQLIIYIGAVLVFVYLTTKLTPGGDFNFWDDSGANRRNCPYKIEGNPNADFVIKYIDSPYCMWCLLEEPVLKELVGTKGNSFKLERYDIRNCKNVIRKYRFAGTPSFVFSTENGTKEYPHSGYISRSKFNKIICEITGDC